MIDKSFLLSQISAAILALDLPAADTKDLLLFLKSAQNTEVSTATLVSELTTRIQAISPSAVLEELLLLVTAVSLITEDRIISVPDLATLESLSGIAAGSIYFVDAENIPYIKKSSGSWVAIDPNLQSDILPNAWSWGNNGFGSLGNNTTTNQSSPVSVVGGFTDWAQIEAGGSHTAAIRANGTAWAWGDNAFGQLGDNTTVSKSSPVSVVGGFTDWVQISGNYRHTAALRADGTAWTWGSNSFGQLGDNTITNQSSPVSVVGGVTNWTQISASGNHTAAIRANGTAWAWGSNGAGQLGNNTATSQRSPVSVVGGFTDWVQIEAGSSHTAAIRANGTAWAWGSNLRGQLGDNTVTNRSSPVSVVGGFTDWVQIEAGSSHTAAIRANGTAWAWGSNLRGQLGDNTVTNRSSPVSVVGGFTDWVQISAGDNHTAAVRANGTAWAWGFNGGRLGDNTLTGKSSPVSVVGGFTDWVQISAGDSHTAAIRANGTAWVWGLNSFGQLGDNTATAKSSPVSVVGGFTDWVQIAAGTYHTAALRGSNSII